MNIAIAWLLKEDWPRWKAIDSQLPSYERWLGRIEGIEAKWKSDGVKAERIVVTPDKFVAWCSANGMQITSNSRATYAAQQLSIRSMMN